MAKLIEQTISITVSKLIKDKDKVGVIFDAESIEALESVVAELVGDDSVLIEVDEIKDYDTAE